MYILETAGIPAGFCSLIPKDKTTIELHDLFVEPSHIGKGHGKELWNYAAQLARNLGFNRMVLSADPNAEPFYVRQGAVRVGEKASSVGADRMLPLMEYILKS